jgi:hypothetical protein
MTITTRRSTTKAGNQTEVVFVSVEDMSRDMLLSYINVMRQLVSLKPIVENKKLDRRAARKAYHARQHYMQNVDVDRSPFSVIREDSGAWVRRGTYKKLHGDQEYSKSSTSHLSDSPEYLSSILSNRCSTIGIHECTLETSGGKSPCLIQVLEMETA